MKTLEEFCYLIIKREEANKIRRRLLSRYHRKQDKLRKEGHRGYSLNVMVSKEIKEYAIFAKAMKNLSKKHYSKYREELGVNVIYNGSNNVKRIIHNDTEYTFQQIKNLSDGYIFDTVCFDKKLIDNPYKKIVSKYT